MHTDQHIYYQAFLSRDPRFDGIFYIGVISTGIYCRPICSARRPKESNCRFFKSASEAEKELFRPCLRCRPELAPDLAPVNKAHRIADLMISCLQEGRFDGIGLEIIAQQFNLSSRQMRRVIQTEFGVSPIQLLLTRRLLLAKQLLTETNLSIIDIAFASGFSSLRRFNDAFKKRYRMSPTDLKKKNPSTSHISSESFNLQLDYRPPYNWTHLLKFLSMRALKGIEWVDEQNYSRTVQIGLCKGWIYVSHVENKHCLKITIASSLLPVLTTLLERLRHFFDLNARPDHISEQLSQDPFLAEEVKNNPGLRIPGTFDGFELAIRAILGQQITVKSAKTVASRFVCSFGEKFETPFPELNYLFPTAKSVSLLTIEKVNSLGIIRSRAQTILLLANEISLDQIKLEVNVNPQRTINQLTSIPGIGQWTAHYIALRALRWPDAFPKEDIVLRKKLGHVSQKQAEQLSQQWRPWRGYATLYLWNKQ
jgi:AraC family transcriptional regulator of adaptative response / DNA-3-methyladenine glycosylase II